MFEKKSRLKPQNPKDDREDPKELDNGESNQESKLKRGIKKISTKSTVKISITLTILELVLMAVIIAIFWAMLSVIFESVVFGRRTWNFLPWWTCDVLAPVGGIALFVVVILQMRKWR